VEEPTVESTGSGPSRTVDLGSPPAGGGRRRRGPRWGDRSSIATLIVTVVVALVSGIVWAVMYLEGIKTTQVEQALTLEFMDDKHRDLVKKVGDEIKRLEELFKEGLSNLSNRLRPQPSPAPAQAPKPEQKGSQ
jgi:hypothetical protein